MKILTTSPCLRFPAAKVVRGGSFVCTTDKPTGRGFVFDTIIINLVLVYHNNMLSKANMLLSSANKMKICLASKTVDAVSKSSFLLTNVREKRVFITTLYTFYCIIYNNLFLSYMYVKVSFVSNLLKGLWLLIFFC